MFAYLCEESYIYKYEKYVHLNQIIKYINHKLLIVQPENIHTYI